MMFTIRGIPTAGIAVGTAFVLQRRASAAATAAAGDPVAEAGRFHAALERAQRAGVVVWVAARCPLGRIRTSPQDPFRDAQGLSPVKARIALQLQLLKDFS